MKNSTAIILTALGFVFGLSVMNAYAQNQTQTDAEQFAGISTNTIIAIVGLAGTILVFLKTLVDRGLLDKRIGTVAVMAGDTVVAVQHNRELIREGLQTGFETVSISNPEQASQILEKSKPIMENITKRVEEYDEKAKTFTRIASNIGKQGERTTDDIKDNQTLKETIPDSVVPT